MIIQNGFIMTFSYMLVISHSHYSFLSPFHSRVPLFPASSLLLQSVSLSPPSTNEYNEGYLHGQLSSGYSTESLFVPWQLAVDSQEQLGSCALSTQTTQPPAACKPSASIRTFWTPKSFMTKYHGFDFVLLCGGSHGCWEEFCAVSALYIEGDTALPSVPSLQLCLLSSGMVPDLGSGEAFMAEQSAVT